MSASLTPDEVRKVAHLARLALSNDEVGRFASQLSNVLGYVEQLDDVDTADVEPLAHPIELCNVFRADEPAESLSPEEALRNAPQTDGRYFLVPQILEGT